MQPVQPGQAGGRDQNVVAVHHQAGDLAAILQRAAAQGAVEPFEHRVGQAVEDVNLQRDLRETGAKAGRDAAHQHVTDHQRPRDAQRSARLATGFHQCAADVVSLGQQAVTSFPLRDFALVGACALCSWRNFT